MAFKERGAGCIKSASRSAEFGQSNSLTPNMSRSLKNKGYERCTGKDLTHDKDDKRYDKTKASFG